MLLLFGIRVWFGSGRGAAAGPAGALGGGRARGSRVRVGLEESVEGVDGIGNGEGEGGGERGGEVGGEFDFVD